MAKLRQRRLEISAATALIAARVPPMPRPVRSRQGRSAATPRAADAPNIPAAMATTQPIIVGRRPTLSATPPRRSDPSAIPNSSIESTQPSVPRSMPQSFAMPGDAKLIDRTSNPSSAFNPTVTSTAAHCATPIAPSSMRAFGKRGNAVGNALLLVNAGEELNQLGHFFFCETRFEPLLVLVDGALGRCQRAASRFGQVQRLLASVAA